MGYIGNAPYQGVVDSGNILDGSIQSGDIANSAITSAKINDSAITSSKLAASSVTSSAIASDVTTLINQGGGPKITAVQVTNSSWTVLDDTAVDTSGGYIKITGTNFASGCTVIAGTTVASAVTFTNSTELRVQFGSLAAGSYVLYVSNPDGGTAIRVNGITFSATPSWTTSSTLPAQDSDTTINIQLAATSATSYALQSGSILPTGITLSSSGLLSGIITGIASDTTYNFTIVATDAELQDSSRTFSITITSAISISRSLTFNYSNRSTDLSKTFASSGNRKAWTYSCWFKRARIGVTETLFSYSTGNTDSTWNTFWITNDNILRFQTWNTIFKATTQLFTDTTAWYHVVLSLNTSDATPSNRIKIYVNGNIVTDFSLSSDPSLNYDTPINNSGLHYIGKSTFDVKGFDGYMAQIHFIDGQTLDCTYFGKTDFNTGSWAPKTYSGTYGTNGFYLNFSDNSDSTATTLGIDSSGNNNNWTPNNFIVTNTSTVWSRYYVYSDASGLVTNPNIFDGTTTTSGASKNGVQQIFTPPTPISFNTLEVLYGNGGNSGAGARLYLNGTQVAQAGSGGGTTYWYTNNTPGTLTTLSIEGGVSGNYESNIYKIKINGKYLIDPIYSDSTIDSPTRYGINTGIGGEVRGNYNTVNRLAPITYNYAYNGNLTISPSSGNTGAIPTNIFQSTGKWYWEVYVLSNAGSTAYLRIGICNHASIGADLGGSSGTWCFLGDGRIYSGGTATNYGTSVTTVDILNIALDIDAGKIWYGKNGTWMASGNPATGANPSQTFTANQLLSPAVASGGYSPAYKLNFGQYKFANTAPTGFLPLCTSSLTNPTIGSSNSTRANTYFKPITYLATGNQLDITTVGFQPDLVWIKNRDGTNDFHNIMDALRGSSFRLYSNGTNAEESTSASFSSFLSNGFRLPSTTNTNTNYPANTKYIAWNWKANASGTSVASGSYGSGLPSISATVSANDTSGFSIVTYTAGGGGTVPHGLSSAPTVYIVFNRTTAGYNHTFKTTVFDGSLDYAFLDTTAAFLDAGESVPTNQVWYPSTALNEGGAANNYVAYLFRPISGYSSFGKYTGNNSTDGPFIYLGFKPAFLLIKRNAAGSNWQILDNARNPYNTTTYRLLANTAGSDSAARNIDFTSNGFKIREIDTDINAASTYFYMAFAETPFKYSTAR